MKTIFIELRTSVLATAVFAILLCGVYPVAVWAGAQLLFPDRANGSLIIDRSGRVRGSTLLAQHFDGPGYFRSRPSAAGLGYDAINSSGTNLGPTSRKLAEQIQAAVAVYRRENGLSSDAPIPADAVTSSGSGLDPQISLGNAELQAPRVARVRGLSLARVREIVRAATDSRDLGVLGEAGVNVVRLNWALDEVDQPPAHPR